jgi:hypothetical protein
VTHPLSLSDRTRAVLSRAINTYRGTASGARLTQTYARLEEPLRIAIAGRVKSGKSTLLNALVGQRLATTDAGECTRIVTWYVDGHRYEVVLHPKQGPPVPARWRREDGAIDVDLGGLHPDDVDEMIVTWPSQMLRTATLIDTPGIGSLTERAARRAWDLLATSGEEETPADAVLYLMKHLHATDVDFLAAFHDNEVSRPNPVNAIGVLSLAEDPKVRRMVQTVVPVAGLLAETALTLTEAEVQHLRQVAEHPPKVVEELLLSADRFVEKMPELGVTSIEREALLGRFGLFGIRLASTLLRRDKAATANDLSRELSERSGLTDLSDVLRSLFLERREVLKSRSALLALATLTRVEPVPGSAMIGTEVEEIIASAHPFNELRVLAAIRAGQVPGKTEVVAELERLIGGSGAASHLRLSLEPDAGATETRAAAAAALARWQRRVENPLTAHELAVAGRVAIRSCEGLLVSLGPGR